jgi:hypothetical protein
MAPRTQRPSMMRVPGGGRMVPPGDHAQDSTPS